jgi:hypothetical protein
VTFSLDDTSAARLEDGKIFGVSSGYATLYAVHDATGAAVTAKISVTSDGEVEHAHRMRFVPAKDATETEEGNTAYYVCEDCEKWFEDEAGTKEITDRSSVVIPVIDPEADYIAPLDELCTMAQVDYRIKNGVNAASAEAEKKEDGSVSIVLSDDEGNVLDTYDIDPTTGIGTDSDGEEVNLPQTGNNSSQNRTIAVGAFLLIIAGGFCIASSARIRRRKEEEAQ